MHLPRRSLRHRAAQSRTPGGLRSGEGHALRLAPAGQPAATDSDDQGRVPGVVHPRSDQCQGEVDSRPSEEPDDGRWQHRTSRRSSLDTDQDISER